LKKEPELKEQYEGGGTLANMMNLSKSRQESSEDEQQDSDQKVKIKRFEMVRYFI